MKHSCVNQITDHLRMIMMNYQQNSSKNLNQSQTKTPPV